MHFSLSSILIETVYLADETAAELSVDEVAIIFSFLTPYEIMRARVCRTWRDAAKKTIVPLCAFKVKSVRSYNAMRAMSTALPNLQQLTIHGLGDGCKFSDGEDPNQEVAAETANYCIHDISIISNFRMLRNLFLDEAPLNGRYPALFSFPLLERLIVSGCYNLKWDLEMPSGCPRLKVLGCLPSPSTTETEHPTGNLRSLRALKSTLEKVVIFHFPNIRGNIMDLADFPHLKMLELRGTNVTGDIRDIRTRDFPAMEMGRLHLPSTVVGGVGYLFQRVSDVPSVMQAFHLLLQRTPNLSLKGVPPFGWNLSEDSPDWYVEDDLIHLERPFHVRLIQVGSRLGWSWHSMHTSCAINWLDPEPRSNYEAYKAELEQIELTINLFSGYREVPPNEEEYRHLCEEILLQAGPPPLLR